MSYAAVFPGQGAAVPGAGEAWRDHPSWELIEKAESLLGRPLGRLLLDADEAELATTGASQMAVLLTSLLGWDALTGALGGDPHGPSASRPSPHPVAFAGHSLGQITALLASGAVDREGGLRLAAERADLSQRSADSNPGRMVALMGATVEAAEEACADLDAWVANDNAPGQVVMAGTGADLDQAAQRARELGARRVMPLAVGHAFHTPLLDDVATGLRPLLGSLAFSDPSAQVVTNTDARGHIDPAGWPERLAGHLVHPVRWRESQLTLAALGAEMFVEIGPGRVLAGLARRTVPEVRVLSISTPDDVTPAAEALRAHAAGRTGPSSTDPAGPPRRPAPSPQELSR